MTEPMIYLDDSGKPRDAVLLRARRAASGLCKLGLREGDAVALLLRNDFAFVEAMHAAALVGAYPIPLNWHSKAEELLYILNDAQPKALIVHADLLEPLRTSLPDTLCVLVVPTPDEIRKRYQLDREAGQLQSGDVVWPRWCDQHAGWDDPPRASRATLFYTSGTTGRPKGVQRAPATREQSAAFETMMTGIFGFKPGVRALICGPTYHSSPNAYLRLALMRAEILVMQSRFDPEETLSLIEQHRIGNAIMVPTMFVRLLKLPRTVRSRYDVSSLKWVTHSGAPCPREVKEELMRWWGPIVHETYGSTEVGAITISTPEDWLAYPGSVGVPVEGARIVIYDQDGRPVPDGIPGEIYVQNPARPDFTYLNHEADRKAIERDGLISVGDIGYLSDRHLYLCDRRADLVISGGANIYPAEVEMILAQCPGVQDCAVFGIPDEEYGESLAAAVQPLPGGAPTEEEIRAYLEPRIAKYKIPRLIEFHAQLPREDSGKIFKRKLREPHWQATGRKI